MVKDRNARCVPVTGSAPNASTRANEKEKSMSNNTVIRRGRPGGLGRLLRRIERERRAWSRHFVDEVPKAGLAGRCRGGPAAGAGRDPQGGLSDGVAGQQGQRQA